jgi:Trypsin-co-occurring domain 1
MSARMIVELSKDHKVFFGAGADAGLAEVGVADDIAKATGDTFKKALGSLAELVKMLEASVGEMPKRPEKIEMEFGAKISGDCNLWIVSGEGEADFKVTLSWGG